MQAKPMKQTEVVWNFLQQAKLRGESCTLNQVQQHTGSKSILSTLKSMVDQGRLSSKEVWSDEQRTTIRLYTTVGNKYIKLTQGRKPNSISKGKVPTKPFRSPATTIHVDTSGPNAAKLASELPAKATKTKLDSSEVKAAALSAVAAEYGIPASQIGDRVTSATALPARLVGADIAECLAIRDYLNNIFK